MKKFMVLFALSALTFTAVTAEAANQPNEQAGGVTQSPTDDLDGKDRSNPNGSIKDSMNGAGTRPAPQDPRGSVGQDRNWPAISILDLIVDTLFGSEK